jgi:cyclopropane fatty-acyl-phospholipid synthase-like methyltransferase
MAKWFERFFTGPLSCGFIGTWESPKALRHARMVRKLLGPRKGARILDAPCGQGKLAVPLARMGFNITGVDITAPYIRRVRKLARAEGLPIRCVHLDMRKIAFEKEFDAVINYGGSFGFFSDEENLDFCRRAFRALKPGGKFLLDGMNRKWVLGDFHDFMVHREAGPRITSRNRFDKKTNRVTSRWTFTQGERREVRSSTIWLFDATDIRKMLRKAGFREIRLYGLPALGRLARSSQRIIAVAERPSD